MAKLELDIAVHVAVCDCGLFRVSKRPGAAIKALRLSAPHSSEICQNHVVRVLVTVLLPAVIEVDGKVAE